jgi:thioredoxin-like negative regulator of GroEL
VSATAPPPVQTKPRLLFFYSPRDGAARRAEGFLAQVLQRRRNHDTFVVHRIDVTERRELAERLRVTETPALVVVTEKKVRARLARPRGCVDIQRLLEPWLR